MKRWILCFLDLDSIDMKNYKIILLYLLTLIVIGCGTIKKKDIYFASEKKVDSVYYSSNIETKPPILSNLIIKEICDSVTNKPVQFKKEFIIKNDTVLVEIADNDLQISVNVAADVISKQDSLIKVQTSEIKELKESYKVKNNIPFKYWVYMILSILLNAFLIYLFIKSKVSLKNLL